MPEIPFLHDIVVLFGAALVVLVLSHRLRLPSIAGFLITGMVVGPSGLGWIADPHHVEVFAELGVVFLLFGIGLELSVDRLIELRRSLLLGGGVQVVLTILATSAVALLLGARSGLALYLGSVVALSSTAIVFKLLSERRELEAPHGQVATGILLFQDFLIVPLLLVVPLLAGAATPSGGAFLVRFGGGILIVVAAFVVGRLLLPRFLRLLVRTRIRELLVIGALFACLGGALITEALGFSLVLGAFLAGILIAESDYHHQVQAEIGPFRDVFNSMFFISVGMLLSLEFAAAHLPLIAGLGLAVVVVKALIVVVAVKALRYPARTQLLTALALAQIGEFSLVLVRSGHKWGLLDEWQYQLAVATAVLTLLLTPLLIALGPRLADTLARRVGALRKDSAGPDDRLVDHVVIVGFGLNGQHLARVLRSARIPYRVVELNDAIVQEAKAAGEPILYGDITHPEIQRSCGMDRAHVAVFAISDPHALRRGVRLTRQLNPRIFLIARSRQLAEIEGLRDCGADLVVAEEFESSIEIVTAVLRRLHVPGNVIQAEARLLRADGYQMLRSAPSAGLSDRLLEALAAGATETFLLASDSVAVDQSLEELGLRTRTGVTVVAVVRDNRPIRNPPPDLALRAADVLVLMGSHVEVEAAFRFLERRPGDLDEAASDP